MEPSNYKLYREERENATVIEDHRGFVAAIPFGEFWYIDEVFIKKEFRKSYAATELADKISKIGKSKGFNTLLGSVDTNCSSADASLKVLQGYGMKLHTTNESIIYLKKNI